MPQDVIKSVGRVFEILEYFEEVGRPLSLNELSTHFRYPTSSTAAMLKSMMHLGYLNYDAKSRTYMPTPRLAELGAWALDAFLHEDELVAAINRLSQRTGETVAVAVQSDLYAQYLHVAYPDEPLQFRIKPGALRSVTASGMGWMLLSAQEDSAIELLWRRSNRARDRKPALSTLATLMKRVRDAREQGFVVSRHTVTQGAGIIAMLLPSAFFGRALAIGVGGPVWRMDEKYDLILKEMRSIVSQFPKPRKKRLVKS
ncbi:MAG: helix-turn-helix domain-containing protein [Rhodoferax sp.]|jgi:IclR family transcriptional regulator, KDG regulon repressor|nr:helix-turn-helix domain-containing protein [Rhodoferax sp.]